MPSKYVTQYYMPLKYVIKTKYANRICDLTKYMIKQTMRLNKICH